MLRTRILTGAALLAGSLLLIEPASGDTYQVIVTGSVTMEDGSPPPFTVGIERVCSDIQGSAPGPITNKKGVYVWHMEFDAFNTRSCYIRATHPGYISTQQPISGINATSRDTQYTVPKLILSRDIPGPDDIRVNEDNLPSKARGPYKAAMKALDAKNNEEVVRQLEIAAEAAPKNGPVWQALGIVEEDALGKPADARKAYEHAVNVDPKLAVAYLDLTRVCLKLKDWQSASQAADTLVKADPKHFYPEVYLHQAVALYWLKDLAGAEAAVQEAILLDPSHKRPREEYVLGRILESKGDMAGAKEHMSKYLQLQPAPPDVDLVRGHLDHLGKPEAKDVEPDLELL
jgi:hypothetical protein